MIKPDYKTLLNEMNGAVPWHLFETSIKLKVFDYLQGWQTAGFIAGKLNTDEKKTELYLDALASCGYLIKYCGRYRNADISNKYLTTHSGLYQGTLILSLSSRRLAGIDNISKLLKNDADDMYLGDEKVWTEALKTLIPFQKAVASEVVSLIKGLKGSDNFSSMLDIGGGPGFIGQTVAQSLKNIHLTLFDLPKVIELAEQNAEIKNITYLAGSYSKDDIGSNYDIIWASRSLYYADDIFRLVSKMADALKDGGYLICLHEGVYNERTQPQEIILNRIGVALKGSDVSFERGEIEYAVQKSGLQIISTISTDDIGGSGDIITARKI